MGGGRCVVAASVPGVGRQWNSTEMLTQWRPRRLAVQAGCDVAKNRTTGQPLSGPNRLGRKILFITFVSLHLQPFSLPEAQMVKNRPRQIDTSEQKITVTLSLPTESCLFQQRCSSWHFLPSGAKIAQLFRFVAYTCRL